MGDAADDLFDRYLDSLFDNDLEPFQDGGLYIWIDNQDNYVDMNEMSNYYLGNCFQICLDHKDTEKAEEILTLLTDRVSS